MHGLKSGDNLSKSADDGGRLPYDVYENGELVPVDRMPLQRAVATGRPTGNVEIEVRTRNGRSANLVGSASPLLDDSGNVRGGVGAFYDVTARKQMEDTLRERAELLELASEAILVCNLDGTITFWNRGAENIFGWTRQEALGQTAENF